MELNNVKDTGVLIVGAGPTGLTLACDLMRRGVPVRVVERSERLFPGSRGKGLQPRTQEVFDDLGVLDAVRRAGGPYPRMQSWEGGRRLGEWDLVERVEPTPHAPYAEAWMLPQWRTQEILFARLLELGGRVEFGVAFESFVQDGDGVTARLARAGGAAEDARAAYLVGCDGGRSAVRAATGIGMTGESVDPSPMLVADVRLDRLDRANWHIWPHAPGGGLLLCPLAGTDDFQVIARYEDTEARPDLSADGVRTLVAERSHLNRDDVREVLWASDFRARAAMADAFRSGRVFLAGDAAHIHSPAGGQGLNTGIQDAYNLGWKLGRVLRRRAGEALLDTYEEERIPVAAGVLGLTTRLHRARMIDGEERVRGTEARQLGLTYRGGPLAAERRTGLGHDALRAGDRAPDAPLTSGPGGARRLFDLFRGPHFTLLVFGDTPAPTKEDPDVHVHRLGPAEESAVAAYAGSGLFLVRPDGHVALATHDAADVAPWLAGAVGARTAP